LTTAVSRVSRQANANYLANHPQRAQYWNGWSNNRNNWSNQYQNVFNNRWWATHYVPRYRPYFNYLSFGFGYPFRYGYGYRPWQYWWGTPSWGSLLGWGGYGWNSPCYYDYGPGGNVVYQQNGVYLDEQLLGSPQEYADSAADLAAVSPDAVRGQTGDWLPLGTFAMVLDKSDADPSRVIQLAIDKQGVISGTMFNKKTDKAYAVTGRVDKETQRVAFRIDNAPDLVFETGLYNLTQNETPVLVHTGSEGSDTMVFARLTPPEDKDTTATQPSKPLAPLLP
jgi:hypothetical protein